jgi:hypothetical protein
MKKTNTEPTKRIFYLKSQKVVNKTYKVLTALTNLKGTKLMSKPKLLHRDLPLNEAENKIFLYERGVLKF